MDAEQRLRYLEKWAALDEGQRAACKAGADALVLLRELRQLQGFSCDCGIGDNTWDRIDALLTRAGRA